MIWLAVAGKRMLNRSGVAIADAVVAAGTVSLFTGPGC